jgi:Transposase IS66 family
MILRFTTDLAVGFTSNQAERDVRPVKVQQRTSGGTWRTLDGLADFAIVQSYLSTAAKWASTPTTHSPNCSPPDPGYPQQSDPDRQPPQRTIPPHPRSPRLNSYPSGSAGTSRPANGTSCSGKPHRVCRCGRLSLARECEPQPRRQRPRLRLCHQGMVVPARGRARSGLVFRAGAKSVPSCRQAGRVMILGVDA